MNNDDASLGSLPLDSSVLSAYSFIFIECDFKGFVVIVNLATFKELEYIPNSDFLHNWSRLATVSSKIFNTIHQENCVGV